MSEDQSLREMREEIVREHMESENRHEQAHLVCERVYFEPATILGQLGPVAAPNT